MARAWLGVTRLVAFGCFTIVAEVVAYLAFACRASCGCLGPLRVVPLGTLVLDLVLVTLLVAVLLAVSCVGPRLACAVGAVLAAEVGSCDFGRLTPSWL